MESQYEEIDHYMLEIYAVKSEQKQCRIEINQSNSKTRKHLKYEPLVFKKLEPNQDNLVSARRLHFGEITKNNKFISNCPNENQKYFNLIVEVKVVTKNGNSFIIHSVESDKKIIVRVSL